MSPEERDIERLTPWSASTMALLCIQGVRFWLQQDTWLHSWHARWQVAGEHDARILSERELWKLVHKVALAYGRTGNGDY